MVKQKSISNSMIIFFFMFYYSIDEKQVCYSYKQKTTFPHGM